MREPLIFLIIFGVLLLLAAMRLRYVRDPRNSILFSRVSGKLSLQEAQNLAKKMSMGVFAVGAAIVISCTIGLLLAS